ncbi:MAG: hypothetical protein EBY17_00650 [Acidobacteriia bacterium]|nr:hypothetical protein [Terriglobia bacterium]
MIVEIRVARVADYPAISRIQEASPEAAQWPVGDYSNYEEPNTPAILLYRKLGWQGLGVRPGYYGQGQIDAVVMKRSSC